MHKLKQLWITLRASFWFVPALIVTAGVTLAVVLVETDSAVFDQWLAGWPRIFGATPEGARQLLATIAGSMMTVMGVTFSMTLVALALASSQYTSRILRSFMRNRVTQGTLGTFAGIFSYCLVVLHTIRSGVDEAVFVPGLAVFFAVLLALGGVGVLIYFIHHIALSIQASSIIAAIAAETMAAIDRLFPEGPAPADDHAVPRLPGPWRSVSAHRDGYIQDVNLVALQRLAQDQDTVVRMHSGVGDFVVKHTALASLALASPPDEATVAALHASCSIGSHRVVDQDLAFGIRQIVDMALKALSPGVNDTSTAVMCVDYLTAILARLAARRFPASHRFQDDRLRVVIPGPTFASLLSAAFDQIRRNAGGTVAILARILGALETIASQTSSPPRREALLVQVQHIAELAHRTVDAAHDRALLEARLVRVRRVLGMGPADAA